MHFYVALACSSYPSFQALQVQWQTAFRSFDNSSQPYCGYRTVFVQAQEGHLERDIPLNKSAKTALDKYLLIRPKTTENILFVTKTGRPLLVRNIRTAIDRYFRKAGIKEAKVNDLRHTWIAHHLVAGTSLVVVSKLAGHKRLSTTEKYLDLIKGQSPESVKLEEL